MLEAGKFLFYSADISLPDTLSFEYILDTVVGCQLDWLVAKWGIQAPALEMNGQFRLSQKILFM